MFYLLLLQVDTTLLKVKHEELRHPLVNAIHVHRVSLLQHSFQGFVDRCVGVQSE